MSRLSLKRTLVVTSAATVLVAAGVGIGIAATSTTVDTNDVRLRVLQSDFADGFDSGWHTHPGAVIVQVQEGFLKITQGGCQPEVVQKGETYLEVPLVPVRAVATGPVKWTTTQIIPVGAPPLTVVSSPC
jgi:quercetin dioxygenase-like cupin family protein